jgi:hypothetical protein
MRNHGPSCLKGPSKRRAWPAPRPDRPLRWDVVRRVRAEIEAGTYDTPERFDAALDRLARSLGLE